MKKKISTLRMFPEDIHRLKIWAAEANKPVGDVIRDILQNMETKAEQRRKILKQAGLNTEARQPTISLALMRGSTIKNMIDHTEALKEEGQIKICFDPPLEGPKVNPDRWGKVMNDEDKA